MAVIRLESMEFYAFHGCYKEEKVCGTRFIVDLTVRLDVSVAGATDQLIDTVNYQTLTEIVAAQMKLPSNLLEHVATQILDEVMARFSVIQSCTVKISKMNPPLGTYMKAVSVELTKNSLGFYEEVFDI